jgi:hypothetical protein
MSANGDAIVAAQPTPNDGASVDARAAAHSVQAWKDCEKLSKSSQEKSRCTLPSVQDLEIVGGTTADRTQTSSIGDGQTSASNFAHSHESGVLNQTQTLERSSTQLANIKTLLSSADSTTDEKLRAAGVLAANGETQLTANGQTYSFKINADHTVTLSVETAGKKTQLSGKLNPDGTLQIPEDQAHRANHQPAEIKSSSAVDTDTKKSGGSDAPPAKGVDALFDPSLSQQDKLKAAQEMAHNGQKRFKGPDGKTYDIGTQRYRDREAVTIMVNDGQGHSRAVLRGIVDKDGNVSQQHDGRGKAVDYGGDWVQKHDPNNAITRHDQPKSDKGEQSQDGQNKGDRREKGDRRDQGEQGEKGNEGDKPKTNDSPEDLKHLEESRTRLQKDADENIYSVHDREKFQADMQAFETRAKQQPLSAKEVADTYDQLSRLMEAQDGKVPKENRVLAAETFAHHMAEPTNIDQGNHNTCNMTALEEHIMTRNPSKAAEVMTTTALTGQWVAPDGKVIKIDEGSLVPGREERNNPPNDGERSYATQLMNLALVNDVEQRKVPPMFYSAGKPEGQGDTGERLKFADGQDVTKDDLFHSGDKTKWNAPAVWSSDIADSAKRLTGDTNFVIVGKDAEDSQQLLHVGSPEELARTLSELKKQGNLPAIIQVDANDTLFNGSGDPTKPNSWHVVSIVGFDEKTGKVKLSNQWGKASDITVNIADLYRSTCARAEQKPKTAD